VVAVVAVIATLALVGAFLLYRSSLERPDPFAERIARNAPDRLSVRQIALRHPDSEGHGMTWTTVEVPLATNHPSVLGKLVVSAWGTRVAESCPSSSAGSPVAHFFYDERRIAYIDLDPAFLQGCTTGTTGEVELMEALEETVRANIPGTSAIVLMSGGIPLTTLGHHLSREYGR
jgi:hypothetical protein